ncbi:MAG: DUF4091 domain-containing protein [Deltaproteobacteria bacterium]|nr:DUF4091 domain-containing protein [Deltaproteobacteria bacterium]
MPSRLPQRVGLVLLATLALIACSGSGKRVEDTGGPSSGPVVVLGPAVKVRPEDAVEGARSAVLVAARNEFESFQIAIRATDAPLRNVTVSLAQPLTGPGGGALPASNVTVYREDYYPVTTPSSPEGAPGRWPDALIPSVDPLFGEARSAFPLEVPAGENRVAWIDVLVPESARPGVYRGTLEVRGDGLAESVPVELTVLAFALPSTASLKTAFTISSDTCTPLDIDGCSSDPTLPARVRQLFVRTALDNRLSLGRPHALPVNDGIGVEQFREHFLPFVRGTAATRLPGAALSTYQVNLITERNLTGFKAEAEADGFVDRAFVWSCDEPDLGENWPHCEDVLRADSEAWPQVPKLVTAPINTVTAGALPLIDIMVVNVTLLDGAVETREYAGNQRPKYDEFLGNGARPKELWLFSACGSHGCAENADASTAGMAGGYQIDAPPSQTRAMAWLAFGYEASGLLYYETALRLSSAWDDQLAAGGNGDGTLFYPGTVARIGGTRAIPLESLRLKYLRDGLEDYEYLKYLRDHGQAADAQRIARELFPATYDTSRSDAQIAAARLELARRVADLTGGPEP